MGYYAATTRSGACYVLLDGQNRPTAVAGAILVQPTNDRGNPPAPICGLNIDYTPLGRGHVMALELGGPDVAENIVPQYQQWQQSGAWRQMEVQAAVQGAVNSLYVCLLTYGNAGDVDSGDFRTRYEDDSMLFWDDFRIPTKFKVWVIGSGTPAGQSITANILAPGLLAGNRQLNAGQLAITLNGVPHFAEFQIDSMPAEDLGYWRSNQLAIVVQSSFEHYEDFHDTADSDTAPWLSPKRPTEVEFIQEYGDDVRSTLEGSFGWLPHEVTQYGTNTHMFQSVYHEKPLKAGTNKKIKTRLEKHKKVKNEWSKKRKKPSEQEKADKARKRLQRFIDNKFK